MPVKNRIQLRRGTSTEWSGSVDILASGEMGWDTTENNIKIGDGSNYWDDLPWLIVAGVSGQVINPSVISGVSGIFLDTSVGDVDLVAGQFGWNSEAGTAEIGLTNDLKIQIGQTVLFRVKNSTGSTLSKGQAVYASGVLGGGQIIQAAPFAVDNSVPEVRFIGLVTDDILNGEDGYVNHFGHIKNVDLRSTNTTINPNGETWAVGDILFVDDTTAGGLTNVQPQDDIYVALVLADGQNGELFVRLTDPGHITDLHDVNMSGLVDNNLMVWNSGSDYWEPASSLYYVDGNVGIGTASPVTKLDVNGVITATGGDSDEWNEAYDWVAASGGLPYVTGVGTANQVAFFNDTDSITSESNLYWDSTNNRLGIGTTSPSEKLHVAGDVIIDGAGGTIGTSTYTNGILRIGESQGISIDTNEIMCNATNGLIIGNIGDEAIRFYQNTSEVARIDAGGNVGIGTTTPGSKLSIYSATLAGNYFTMRRGVGGFDFKLDAGGNVIESVGKTCIIGPTDAQVLRLKTNDTTRVHITSDGLVGINTVSPTTQLDVNGSVNVANDVIVGGNVTVNGTTVTANVDTMEVEDPIITLGQASGNVITDTSLDRGLALIVSTGVTAFMGWDTSESEFSLLSSGVAANSSGNYTPGTYGDLHIGGLTATTANFSSTIDAASLGTGEDNSVVILDSDGKLRTDEIDSRVWGSSLVDGSGSANYISKWSDADTLTTSQIHDNGTNVGINTTATESKKFVVNSNTAYDGILVKGNGAPSVFFSPTSSSLDWRIGNAGSNGNYFTIASSTSTSDEHFVITSGGNVGIGESSPTSPLYVRGKGFFNDDAGNAHSIEAYRGGSTNSNIKISNGDGYWAIGKASDGFFGISPDSLNTNAGSVFAITTGGNVGIGDTTPSYKLEVNGTAGFQSTINAPNLGTGEDNSVVILDSDGKLRTDEIDSRVWGTSLVDGAGSANHVAFWSDTNTLTYDSAQLYWDSTNNRLGIGTSSPTKRLELGTAADVFYFNGTAGGGNEGIQFKDSGGSSRYALIFPGSNEVRLTNRASGGAVTLYGNNGTGGGEEARLTLPGSSNGGAYFSNGNVGIGTASPSTQLDVSGSGNFSGDVTIDGHLSAATKSFLINHPTREGHKLQYGSLESPYHGVRLTGRARVDNGWCVVKLPEYISELVHNNNDINIQITNIKHGKVLYVDDTNIANNEFTVKTDSWLSTNGLEFFWTFTAVRKDVKELQVEF